MPWIDSSGRLALHSVCFSYQNRSAPYNPYQLKQWLYHSLQISTATTNNILYVTVFIQCHIMSSPQSSATPLDCLYRKKSLLLFACGLLSPSRVFLLDTAIPNHAEILKGIVLAQHVKAKLRCCASLSLILSALRGLRWASRAGQIKYPKKHDYSGYSIVSTTMHIGGLIHIHASISFDLEGEWRWMKIDQPEHLHEATLNIIN